jgi:hypothetical protein
MGYWIINSQYISHRIWKLETQLRTFFQLTLKRTIKIQFTFSGSAGDRMGGRWHRTTRWIHIFLRKGENNHDLGNSVKHNIIGGDLNLPQVDWKWVAEGISVTQAFINRLMWDNGYTQVVGKTMRGDSLLDVYLVGPESAHISCDTVQGISDHCGVLLEVEWMENGCVTQGKRLVPAYQETYVVGLQNVLRDKLPIWPSSDSSVEDIWKNCKDIILLRGS